VSFALSDFPQPMLDLIPIDSGDRNTAEDVPTKNLGCSFRPYSCNLCITDQTSCSERS
jgi:hypothetical protein